MKALLFSLCAIVLSLVFSACSSTSTKSSSAMSSVDSAVIADAIEKQGGSPSVEEKEGNIEDAHNAFIMALDMEHRGLSTEAEAFWLQAAAADPNSRFLAFKKAVLLSEQGNDSLALVEACRGKQLAGRVLASQLGLLAHLYVSAGMADSSRKYFLAALDSSKYQDMPLLYDYSLFLEAVQDKEELVRVYELLLPQVNYMQSLFRRQLELLVELERDSAIVELFMNAHNATGEKDLLVTLVDGLGLQNRTSEVKAIADTLTGVSYENEKIVLTALKLIDDDQDARNWVYKKFYEDGVRTPQIENILGFLEMRYGSSDSAEVLLLHAQEGLTDPNVAISNRFALVALYGSTKKYDKASALLDSLLNSWQNLVPMEGVVDSASMESLTQSLAKNIIRAKNSYSQLLFLEASSMMEFYKGIPEKTEIAKKKFEKSLSLITDVISSDLALSNSPFGMNAREHIAATLEQLGRIDEAYAVYEVLLDSSNKFSDKPGVLNSYGYSMICQNRSREEVEKGYAMVLKALELDDGSHRNAYLDSKAWGLYRMGKYEDALKTMQEIKDEQFQEDFEFLEHMGAIYEALKRKEEATHFYQKLLNICPSHPDANRFFGKTK